jgi:sulfite reductase (NADPH) flavoprotein alpha-component
MAFQKQKSMNHTQETIKELDENKQVITSAAIALHIIFGSRTGNSRAAATLAYDYAVHLGIDCYLHDMQLLDVSSIHLMKNILLAVSTHGEGDPPAVVEDFYNFIHSENAPSMKGSRFGVLALGDSSYKDYCKTGYDFRHRLLTLGSQELITIVECDIDYEEQAKQWVRKAVDTFSALLPKIKEENNKEFAFEINKIETGDEKMFYAKVLEKKLLTNPAYTKRTLHLVLSADNFSAEFQPGDSFGIYTGNSRLLVDRLLKQLGFDGSVGVQSGKEYKLLKEALIMDYEITLITPIVVEKYASISGNEKLKELVSNVRLLEKYCENHDVMDLVTDYPSSLTPDEFISVLRKLTPRLYSVANSPLKYPNEVHLTVGLMEYELKNRLHAGVSTEFLDNRVEAGDSVPLFLEVNEKFRVPKDDSLPIVMIATGTGIAPFRGFLQYRDAKGASGDNWLFFGDRYSESDNLYQNELLSYSKKGLLTHFTTAFSRDQKEKVYVQHRMNENSEKLFEWIHHRKAVIYICGNKRTMGKDVKIALEFIIAKEGGMSSQEAADYMQELRSDKRLQMDLY